MGRDKGHGCDVGGCCERGGPGSGARVEVWSMLDGARNTGESEGGECGDGGGNRDDDVFAPG